MRLGFAVKVLGAEGLPSHDTRRHQSGPHLRHSLECLEEILEYCDDQDIRMYRMATALAPYASHPELPQFRDQAHECAEELALSRRIGRPVVWDVLHHHVVPKMHFSSPRTDTEERKKKVGRRVVRTLAMPQLRAHADLVDPITFEHFLRDTVRGREVDVMLEAKAKDLALLRLREQLTERGAIA